MQHLPAAERSITSECAVMALISTRSVGFLSFDGSVLEHCRENLSKTIRQTAAIKLMGPVPGGEITGAFPGRKAAAYAFGLWRNLGCFFQAAPRSTLRSTRACNAPERSFVGNAPVRKQ